MNLSQKAKSPAGRQPVRGSLIRETEALAIRLAPEHEQDRRDPISPSSPRGGMRQADVGLTTKKNIMPCPIHAMLGLTSTTGPTASAAEKVRSIKLTAAIDEAKKFAKERLPVLNEEVLNRTHNYGDFIREVTPVLNPFVKAMFGSSPWWGRALGKSPTLIGAPSLEEARQALQVIGFLTDSLERHSQAGGVGPGAALTTLGPVPAAMTILGYIAGTVPRSTAYTYWIANDLNNSIHFTRNPGEAAFHRAVVTIDMLHRQTAVLLRPLAMLDELPDSPFGIEQEELADQFQQGVLVAYKQLAAKTDDGQFVLTPHFFTTVMRTFLPTYPVAGESLSGPNAAYLLNQRSVDALLGLMNEDFEMFVREHELRYMPVEDQRQLVADLECPSLPAQLCAKALDLSFDKILRVPDDELVKRMAEISSAQRVAFGAYFRLCSTAGKARSVHRAMVRTWLEDEEQKLTLEEKNALPVKANQGTGGAKMVDLDGIVEMIRNNPRVAKLWRAFKATGGSNPSLAVQDGPGRGPAPVGCVSP